VSPRSSAEMPCVECGLARIGNFHRRCAKHENPKWVKSCYLCKRKDGKPHDALLGPYVSPLKKDVL
jgi:hypothetical protein